MGSATSSTILFLTGIAMLRRSSKDQPDTSLEARLDLK